MIPYDDFKSKAIHHLGKRSCIAIKEPYLSTHYIEQRLEFARAHLHWTVNDWSQVVCTDKSLLELGESVTQKRVWQTPEQKFELDSMAVNHQSGRQLMIIWGAICGPIQSELIIMPLGQLRAVDFINNIYKPGLLPFMDKSVEVSVAANREELTLMEDGTPIHTSLASQQWCQDHQIQTFAWPPSSPDLNPIENLWYKMKFVVTNLFNPKTMEDSSEAIHIVWDTMPFNHLAELLVSMPARMQMELLPNFDLGPTHA
ncbi:hypothetical protein O181_014531 [Austropuccinia psidii MF-1]|uniref:Tc1-like transposase DDE domain-containing protein n=1 Tax=Austropuccinia psidii MF-1 TaxID=1389203 RepID=A0A9Q3C1W7_9BASI|nr:hypothetical protein [Austropuccinia psidii MF-1]